MNSQRSFILSDLRCGGGFKLIKILLFKKVEIDSLICIDLFFWVAFKMHSPQNIFNPGRDPNYRPR